MRYQMASVLENLGFHARGGQWRIRLAGPTLDRIEQGCGNRRRLLFSSKVEVFRMPVNLSIKNAPDDLVDPAEAASATQPPLATRGNVGDYRGAVRQPRS